MQKLVKGFSKKTKEEKIDWLTTHYFEDAVAAQHGFKKYWNNDVQLQQLHDEFIENTVTNFYLPLGVAPNFLINDQVYAIPMAIEESSVVAAAAKAAHFWKERGGFKATVINTEKIGQVHFMYKGDVSKLVAFFEECKPAFWKDTAFITQNMQKRGGGILDIQLIDKTDLLPHYFQLHASFDTKDSMGANFINSCLEQFATTLQSQAQLYSDFSETEKDINVIMSILSNYVPHCLVRAEVSCPTEALSDTQHPDGGAFASKFVEALQIAKIEPYRAVTHNKGIMNGIDAVVIATGNDFRAIEAGVHAYAAKSGRYASLSDATVIDGIFKFWIEIPLALGTVGGLTQLHPMVKQSLEMLGNPSSKKLMEIIAVAGLAQNFAAVRSLITTGIQKGHMKMHLMNILNQMEANDTERRSVQKYFENNAITHAAVVSYLHQLRS